MKTVAMSLKHCCYFDFGKSNLINVLVRTDVSSNRPNRRRRRNRLRVSSTRIHQRTMARSNRRILKSPSSQVTSRVSTLTSRSSTRIHHQGHTTKEDDHRILSR